jgi:protein-tyrosine-phosphatase
MKTLIVALAIQTMLTPQRPPEIVFVCEHGAAKSVIAAAWFNRLATERGLLERAIYRGASRDAIKRHVEQLIQQIQSRKKPA